jgi:multidrug efflux pump subunit AcrB
LVVGRLFSYFQLGQLEDPEFSIKTAAITTTYPGASAEQVELEVTDRIETKLQEMVELKCIYSNSRPGLSIIKIDIKSEYWSDRLPQVWDVLRKKIADIEPSLPPGAGKPQVGDDFGFASAFAVGQQRRVPYAELNGTSRICEGIECRSGVAVDLWECKRNASTWTFPRATWLGLTPNR